MFQYTADQCCEKFKGLTRTYKRIKDSLGQSGAGGGKASTRFSFYNEMDNLLSERPSTSCSSTVATMSVAPSLSSDDVPVPLPEASTEPAHKKQKKCNKKDVNPFQQFMMDYFTEKKERREERDRAKDQDRAERLNIEKSKIDLLKRLIEQ